MAEWWENLNLFKPGTDDFMGVEDSLNGNFQKIDEKLGNALNMPDGTKKDSLGQRLNEQDVLMNAMQSDLNDEKAEEFIRAIDESSVGSIASRGFARCAPENTLAAFYGAVATGFWGIRTDIRMTKDKEFVCLTDATIDRTSNATGNVADKTLAELKALDFGTWYKTIYANERIPTMSQMLELCHDYNMIAYLEIPVTLTITEMQSLLDKIDDKGMMNNMAIVSFDYPALLNFRDLNPRIALGYGSSAFNQQAVDRVKSLKRSFLYTPITQITTANMKLANKANIKVDAYNYIDTTFSEIEVAVRKGIRRVVSRKHNFHPF